MNTERFEMPPDKTITGLYSEGSIRDKFNCETREYTRIVRDREIDERCGDCTACFDRNGKTAKFGSFACGYAFGTINSPSFLKRYGAQFIATEIALYLDRTALQEVK